MRLIGLAGLVAVVGSLGYVSPTFAETPRSTGSALRSWFSGTSDRAPDKPSSSPPATVAAPPASGSSEPVMHFLRQTTCTIPFTVDAGQTAPLELQLFVSMDRGTNWKLYAKSNPQAGQFTFRAMIDGEYWFALRTIERGRPPVDLKKLQPGLKVVFDTRPPDLELEASAASDGTVLAKWKATDVNLDPQTLKAEHRSSSSSPWEHWPGISAKDSRNLIEFMREVRADPGAETLLLRAEVRDRAGNNAVVTRQVTVKNLQNPAALTDRGQKLLPNAPAGAAVSWPSDNTIPTAVVAPPLHNRSGELPPPQPSTELPPSSAWNGKATPPKFSPASQTNEGPLTTGSATPEVSAAGEILPTPTAESVPTPQPAGNPTVESTTTISSTPVSGIGIPLLTPTQPGISGMAPAPSIPVTPAPAAESPATTVEPADLPRGEQPQWTNARQFSLDYEIEAAGPNGVDRVDLWGTSDGGQTWTRWLTDSDRHSPVDVQVHQDGLFGFRIVVVAVNQLSSLVPQPGEAADIWVGVDSAAPDVRITSALYGEGDYTGHLDIRWQVSDANLADRPVTLSFSERREGPWSIIAAGLPNTGQYHWPAEPRIPREIYLRIEARDAAGQVSQHVVAEPINTSGLMPQGRIRGLRAPPAAPDRSATRWHR